jgi:hypothetical protein
MSKKTTYILLGIFAALLVIFILQRSLTHPATEQKSLEDLSVKFDPLAVNAIQVFKQDYPDSGLMFAKKDTGWVVVNDYNTPAKSTEIDKLLADLSAVHGTVRGESEDLYPDFSITDQNALQIKLTGADNSTLAHVYIGKGGPDGKTCFMRLPGSPKVYMADNNFISRFAAWAATPEKKLPTDRWMNLGLCTLDKGAVTAFKLHTPKTDYDFTQVIQAPGDSANPATKTWQQNAPTRGMKLDEGKIRGLQSSICGVSAIGVANPALANSNSLDKPPYSIWVSDSLGNSMLLNFSDKIDTLEQRYVTVQGRSTVFRINKGIFERIFVNPFEPPKEPKPATTPKPTTGKKATPKK